jgi:hypothetical protein
MASVDIRDYGDSDKIEIKLMVAVAVKGYGDDWAAYIMPVELREVEAYGLTSLADKAASNGEKLPEYTAKNLVFPTIGGGPYRD